MKQYTTLLMDADETLLDFSRSERFALQTTLASVGVEMTTEMNACYHEINRLLWEQLERGEIERPRLKVKRFEDLFERFDIHGVDAAAFNERYMSNIGLRGFVLEGAMQLLEDLRERYTIHIITNGSASVQHTRFADSGLLPFIDRLFISEEVGADKPSEVFFKRVLHAIGDPPKDGLLVIGDSLTSDILGGVRSHIDTCWYNPKGAASPEEITPTYEVASFEELRQLLSE